MDRNEVRLNKLIAAQALVDKLLAEADNARRMAAKLADEGRNVSQFWEGAATGYTSAADLLDDLL